MIGELISHYRIIEELGRGGMGVVYKAQDTKLDRFVALKFLTKTVSSSEADRERFLQEAKAAATLNHPNICTIYEVQDTDGQLFIAMEYIEGETLREKKENISFKQSVDLGIQIAEGLAAAHEKGIVHRDIKPDNIMIRKDGIAQIMDFGLAKLKFPNSAVTRLTKEGSRVGTVGYMSPEQIQGHDTDHRSDIFSLGIVLYELFTGQLPFRGVHETALLYEIVNVDPPPPTTVKVGLDPLLDSIVLECLEKDPEERTQGAKQLSLDLKRYARESAHSRSIRTTSTRSKFPSGHEPGGVDGSKLHWRTLVWPLVAIVTALALISVLWFSGRQDAGAHSVTRLGLILPQGQILNLASYGPLAISPDGALIVYRANGRLFRRSLASFGETPLAGTEDGSGPFFSPDGKWIGFFAAGLLKKIPANGGAALTLAEASDNRGASWGKNGDIVFTPVTNRGLMRLGAEGGAIRTVTVPDTTKNERSHRWPAFLPDGKTILCAIGTRDSPDYYDDASIEAVNIETGGRKFIMKGGSYPQYISPGYLVYWNSSSLFVVPFDLEKLEVKGAAIPFVEHVSGDPTTGAAGYTIAQNGTLAYIPGNAGDGNASLVKIDLKGVVTPLGAQMKPYRDLRISPDGKKVAVVAQSGKDLDVWIYDMTRNFQSKFTYGGNNRTPVWSADGKRIAFCSYKDATYSLVIKNADGSGSPTLIPSPLRAVYIDAWLKDGSKLILDNGGGYGVGEGTYGIFLFPLTGDFQPIPLLASKFDEWNASLSPDEKWFAYVSNESGVPQIYIRAFPNDGRSWQVSGEEGYVPRWSPDGKILYFNSPGRLMAVPIHTGSTAVIGKPATLFSGFFPRLTTSDRHYDISPDGKFFVSIESNADNDNFRQIHLVMNWFDDIHARNSANR